MMIIQTLLPPAFVCAMLLIWSNDPISSYFPAHREAWKKWRAKMVDGRRPFFQQLLACPYCLGVWLSGAQSLLFLDGLKEWLFAFVWGYAAGLFLLNRIALKKNEEAPKRYADELRARSCKGCSKTNAP